ncbi:hypothetical protein DMENIID0001_084580 [Sergentomyia squamirostris]
MEVMSSCEGDRLNETQNQDHVMSTDLRTKKLRYDRQPSSLARSVTFTAVFRNYVTRRQIVKFRGQATLGAKHKLGERRVGIWCLEQQGTRRKYGFFENSTSLDAKQPRKRNLPASCTPFDQWVAVRGGASALLNTTAIEMERTVVCGLITVTSLSRTLFVVGRATYYWVLSDNLAL